MPAGSDSQQGTMQRVPQTDQESLFTMPMAIPASDATASDPFNVNATHQGPGAINNGAPTALKFAFPRTAPALPNNNFSLSFANADKAEPVAYPRKSRSSSDEDVQLFRKRHDDAVRVIMHAIDSNEHEDIPDPGKKRGPWKAEELQKWMEWYRTHHEETREILDDDDKHELLESRAWMVAEMIAKTQENGVRVDLSNSDELYSCSDRLSAVVKELRG